MAVAFVRGLKAGASLQAILQGRHSLTPAGAVKRHSYRKAIAYQQTPASAF
jgi:hypothetical protein